MPELPAARLGDDIAHSDAGMGMALGIGLGILAGAVLVGATIATGGAALVVVAAVGGAAAMTSAGGLGGMYIGEASMGPPCGKFVTGSPNVLVNGRLATFTFGSAAACSKDGPAPQPLATGAATVHINFGLAGRETEKIACSAKSIAQTSPDVLIGGDSAQDPRVELTPEVPEWAVTGLQILGVAGAIMALPASIAALGVAGTAATALLGTAGSIGLTMAARPLGEALGLSEAGIRALEVGGGIVGGVLGGSAGARTFVPRQPTALPPPGAPSRKPPWVQRMDEGNAFNRQQAPKYPHNEVSLDIPPGAKGHPRVDSYKPGSEIVSRKHTQLGEVQPKTANGYLDEFANKYPPGTKIANVDSQLPGSGHQNAGLAGKKLEGQMILEVPPQNQPIPQSVINHADDLGIIIRDSNGKVYP